MTAHRLNQLEVALRLGDEALARPLMDRVAALRSTGIAPLLDRVFDAASPPGQLHRIDRLDIDLGHLPWDGLEHVLLQRLEDALRRALAQALRDQPAARTDADAAREWLACRARTGLLPWWAGPVGDAASARQIQVLRAARGWLALLASLADAPIALRRLAQVGGIAAIALDDDAGTALLQAAAAELAQRLAAAGAAAALGSPAPAVAGLPDGARALAGDTPSARTWRACLLTALARGAGGSVQTVVDTALDLLPEGDRQRLDTGAALPARSPEAAAALGRLAAAGQGRASASRGADAAAAPAAAGKRRGDVDDARPGQRTPQVTGLPPPPPPSTPDTALAPAGGKPAAVGDAAHDATAGPARRAARQALAALDWIDVPDAGLVLLWPFIERLFQHCGLLTDERGFLHGAARTRGVLLLAQLSWAEPAPAEPRLALAKLLCGLEPDAAFEPDQPPTADEAAACADLLAAALAHAGTAVPAVARLEVAAFQTLFVQRPGLLGARHGSWLLQPAQRAEDALLDRLPWGWSWVRLPWMAHPLQVQW